MFYPLVDEVWRLDCARLTPVERLVRDHPADLFHSIHLGGYAVLAGTRAGLAILSEQLEPVQQGRVTYPFRLAQHGPYHTPLVEETSRAARTLLKDLRFRQPEVELIDGLGRRHTPWGASPEALREYTLGAQVTDTYDFTRSLEVALLEHAPDQLIATGPGNTLGGVCAQILIKNRLRGVDSREAFQRVQDGPVPVLVSLDR